MRKFTVFTIAVFSILLLNAGAFGQCVSLTTLGSASTQNFDTLSNTAGSTTNNLTITGWFMTEGGGGARDNEQYAVDTGASGTGDTYSYGAAGSTERALGALRTGTLIPNFGACYTNNTGSTINSLAIAYTGEEWRLNVIGRTDQINFEYSTNATDLTTGTWTNVSALNFVTPDIAGTTGAKNGNAAADRTALSSTISSLSIANGATFWIRWTDVDVSGADDGLAVDDFSLTPQFIAPPPALTINDVSLSEGNAGTTSFTFTVSLSAPAPAGGVTFDIATQNNTATAPGDYAAKSLTSQTIPAGSSTYSFTVLANGERVVEPNETFFVNVTNVAGATVTDGQGQGTIVNDDNAGTIQFSQSSYQSFENDGTLDFTVTRTGGVDGAVSANYATSPLSANGGSSCGAGVDYLVSIGTVAFADGDSAPKTISVPLCDDSVFEGSEAVRLTLSNQTTGNGVATTADGNILNDDEAPVVSIGNVAQAEGNSGTTAFVFTVTKTGATALNATVNYATSDETATVADNDYQPTSGTLTFLPNETSKTITVLVNGDATIEANEDFAVALSNPVNTNIFSAFGFGSVLDDDDPTPASVQFTDTNFQEDESQTLILTVERTGNISGSTTVDYSVPELLGAPATGGAACTNGVDYITPSGTLTFAPGDSLKEISVQICGDLMVESNEYFTVQLSNVAGGVIGKAAFANVEINDTASQFANTDDITIGIGNEGNPYPSEINVSGAPAIINSMRLTLYDFSHFSSEQLDLLLVGPQGQKFIIMADAGGNSGLDVPTTITFDDNAVSYLPDSTPIATGSYKPTSWETGQSDFPAPAPGGPYIEPYPGNPPPQPEGVVVPTLASVFGGTNPNGTWRLYIRDDSSPKFTANLGIGGSVAGGWALQFVGPTAAGVSIGGQLTLGKTPIANQTVMLTGGTLTEPLIVKTNSLGNYQFDGLTAGQTYVVTIISSRYHFPSPTRIISAEDNVLGADFEAEER